MKKLTLSISVIAVFGFYVLFARSRDISTVVFNADDSAKKNKELGDVNSNTSTIPVSDNSSAVPTPVITTPKVKKTTCVWKSTDDDEGRYVCTTTLVDATTVKTPTATPKTTTVTPKPTTIPKVTPTPAPAPKPTNANGWKDGTFTGDSVDAYYGNVQVSATISGGRLTNVAFLDYPQDRSTSLRKSQNAMPILKSEAISAQSSNVDYVSGATYTSDAFNQSLASALVKAKA